MKKERRKPAPLSRRVASLLGRGDSAHASMWSQNLGPIPHCGLLALACMFDWNRRDHLLRLWRTSE
jgi:hypothetical protein